MQAPYREGWCSSWESFSRRESHPALPQEEPREQMLKAKLSCPPLSHMHSPENQPRRRRRSLDGRGKRTTRKARLDAAREEGAPQTLLNVLIGRVCLKDSFSNLVDNGSKVELSSLILPKWCQG